MAKKFKLHDYVIGDKQQCIGSPMLNSEFVTACLNEANDQESEFDISSVGGDVFQGIAMYDLIKSNGKADTRIGALAASSASLVAMAGRRVTMSKYGLLMIHKPMTMSGGNSDQLQADVDRLNAVQGRIAQIYIDKTGLDAETVNSLINAVTWMTADQALSLGFIDAIEDYTAEITNHAQIKPYVTATAGAVYQRVFNKLEIAPISNEMNVEDKALIEKNNGLFTQILNFFKGITNSVTTNKGVLNHVGPLAVGNKVTNAEGGDMEDGEYDYENAGKPVKMTVKGGIVTNISGDEAEPADNATEEEKEAVKNNVVLNTLGLKVTNAVEAAGIVKVITNQVATIQEQNALIVTLRDQLAVSNTAVARDEAAIRATIKSEFEVSGSKRSDGSVVNTAQTEAFKPTTNVAQQAVKRALAGSGGVVLKEQTQA